MVFKLRTERITLKGCAAPLPISNKLCAERFTVLAVTGGHFRVVAKLVDLHTVGVPADDPLHLATASEHETTVFILDERLAAAVPVLGVPTQLLA